MNNTLIILVTYNRINLLKESMQAINQSSIPCDVLIVDNHSNDGTNKFINDYSLDKGIVHYFDTGSNLGGAGGYNYGLKKACSIKENYTYFWLMDDDCIIQKDSLKYLLDFANEINNNFGFLSSKVLWTDNSICKTNIQRLKVAKKINDFSSDVVKVDYASFVSVLFQKEDVLKLGLPIKDFFIWTDDLEYTRRFSRIKPSYLINKSIVIHKCKGNYGVDITKELPERIDRYKYIYRNDYYTFKREGIRGYAFLWARYIYHVLKVLFLSSNKLEKINTINNGYKDGLKFNPQIEYV